MSRHDLSGTERAAIRPLRLNKPRGVRRYAPGVPDGMLLARCSGLPRTRAPLGNRFNRWWASGVWPRIFDVLSDGYDGGTVMILLRTLLRNALPTVDSSVVLDHQHGTPIEKGPPWAAPAAA